MAHAMTHANFLRAVMWRDIDSDYTSQLLAKTVIVVLIPKPIKQCEQYLKSVAIHNSVERMFKPSLNQSLNNKKDELIEPTFETVIYVLGPEGTIPYVLLFSLYTFLSLLTTSLMKRLG